MQKLKNIFKKRFIRKSLALLLLFGVGTAFFQSNIVTPQAVHAQGTQATDKSAIGTQETENKLIAKTQTLEAILKIIYILLWPLLALAGLTLNNGMIYGSFFALDAPLWKFWNIMKNFANFTLGFLVLFEIIKNIFSGFNKEKAITGPMTVIKKALIAGILIQMSWFLLAAVIDVSTIATYAIGGLPLSVLKTNDDLGNKPVMGNHTNFNLKDYESVNKTADNFDIWYSYGEAKKISKCEIKDGKYIIGLTNGSRSNEENTNSSTFKYKNKDLELCIHGSILYAFDEHNNLRDAKTAAEYSTILGGLWDSTETHKDFIGDSGIANTCPPDTDVATLEKISGLPKYGVNLENCSSRLLAKQLAEEWLKDQRDNNDGMTMSKMLTKLEGFTGPLVTMYASLMNFAEISNVSKEGENSGAMWIELLIKTIFALALIVPLALLCVVLLARIGVLRMVIAFMPFLVLIWVFGWDDKIGKGGDGAGKLMDLVGRPEKLAGIIFAPVIIVFALSISVIFMTALSNMLNDDAKQHDFFETVGMVYDEETQGINLLGVVDTHMNGNDTGTDFDNIKSFSSWLFMNMFGIALVWMLLFAAIKATSLGGKGINDSMGGADKLLGKALGAIPIMSVKGKDGKRHGIGLSALSSEVPMAASRHLDKMTNADRDQLKDMLSGGSKGTGPDAMAVQKYNALIGSGFSASAAAKTVGFSEKQITESIPYQNHVTMHTELDQHSNTSGGKISNEKARGMTRSQLSHALNSGRIDIAGGSDFQTSEGLVHVESFPSAFGKLRYVVTKSVDSDNDGKISDEEQKNFDKKIEDAKNEELALAKSNKEFIEILKKKNPNLFGGKYKVMYESPQTNTNTNTGETPTE